MVNVELKLIRQLAPFVNYIVYNIDIQRNSYILVIYYNNYKLNDLIIIIAYFDSVPDNRQMALRSFRLVRKRRVVWRGWLAGRRFVSEL